MPWYPWVKNGLGKLGRFRHPSYKKAKQCAILNWRKSVFELSFPHKGLSSLTKFYFLLCSFLQYSESHKKQWSLILTAVIAYKNASYMLCSSVETHYKKAVQCQVWMKGYNIKSNEWVSCSIHCLKYVPKDWKICVSTFQYAITDITNLLVLHTYLWNNRTIFPIRT